MNAVLSQGYSICMLMCVYTYMCMYANVCLYMCVTC